MDFGLECKFLDWPSCLIYMVVLKAMVRQFIVSRRYSDSGSGIKHSLHFFWTVSGFDRGNIDFIKKKNLKAKWIVTEKEKIMEESVLNLWVHYMEMFLNICG